METINRVKVVSIPRQPDKTVYVESMRSGEKFLKYFGIKDIILDDLGHINRRY